MLGVEDGSQHLGKLRDDFAPETHSASLFIPFCLSNENSFARLCFQIKTICLNWSKTEIWSEAEVNLLSACPMGQRGSVFSSLCLIQWYRPGILPVRHQIHLTKKLDSIQESLVGLQMLLCAVLKSFSSLCSHQAKTTSGLSLVEGEGLGSLWLKHRKQGEGRKVTNVVTKLGLQLRT